MKAIALSAVLLLLAGCTDVSSAFDLNATRNVADQFMQKMARGDLNGAWEMCDHDSLSRDTLDDIANNAEFADVFRHYKGLDHGDGGERKPGEEFIDVTLAPADIEGADGWQAQFALRKHGDAWRIIAFRIKRK